MAYYSHRTLSHKIQLRVYLLQHVFVCVSGAQIMSTSRHSAVFYCMATKFPYTTQGSSDSKINMWDVLPPVCEGNWDRRSRWFFRDNTCRKTSNISRNLAGNKIVYLIIIIKPEVWIINHCLGLGHETMVCAVRLTMFLWICDMTRLLRGTFHVLVVFAPNLVLCHLACSITILLGTLLMSDT